MKEIFKKNCSKFLIFVHMISLSPVYAMESVDGELDKQEIFDYLESSNSKIDLTDNIVDDEILNKDENYSDEDISDNVSDDISVIDNVDKLNKNNIAIVGAIIVTIVGLVYYVFKRKK